MNKKIIVFGTDGMLLNNKLGAIKDILISLGKEKETRKIDEEYQRRKFAGPWGLEELVKLYKGFSEKELQKISLNYCQKNLVSEVEEFIKELKKRGYLVGILTSNPQFVAETLLKILSLDFAEGLKFEFLQGKATGKIERKVERYIKAEILKEKADEFKIEKKNIIVIGGSLTDLPMAKEAGKFIAFNISEEAKVREEIEKYADIIIEKKDLKEIIKYL